MLEKGLGLAIIAHRAPFSGTVYDVGPTQAHFPWISGNDPSRFRPFYVLVIGQERQVARYLDQLVGGKGDAGHEAIFFPTALAWPPISWGEGKAVLTVAAVESPPKDTAQLRQIGRYTLRSSGETCQIVAQIRRQDSSPELLNSAVRAQR